MKCGLSAEDFPLEMVEGRFLVIRTLNRLFISLRRTFLSIMSSSYQKKHFTPDHFDIPYSVSDSRTLFDNLRQKANTLFTAVLDLPPCSDDVEDHFARVWIYFVVIIFFLIFIYF